MFAITGMTGRVGAAVADHLLKDGAQVRAVIRNPEKAARWKERGCELVVADMNMDQIEEVRRTWQFYRDRRPDLYEGLVKP